MSRRALVFVATLTCCGGGPGHIGSSAARDVVIKVYNKEIQFTQPRACDIFLERRVSDEKGRVVEYDASVNGHDASVVYALVATDPFPLHVSVFDARGRGLLFVDVADHDLEVLGPDGLLLRSVVNYDGTAAQTTVQGTVTIGDTDGLTLLGCALAGRSELGDIAAFLRNLSSGGLVPGQTDVGQSSENPQPILPHWMGGVTLLGAFKLVSGCLDRSSWHCGCWSDGGWCS
jgi:hypothetical protein